MPVTGFYLHRLGTRLTPAIGSVIVGLGCILSSFATQVGGLIISHGVIGGTGTGIVYGVPILVVSRWFPDKKELAIGLTIVGFGLCPRITAPLANRLIEVYTVRPTLSRPGIAMMVIIVALSFTMKLPPKIWQPQPVLNQPAVASAPHHPTSIFRNRSYYGLWICHGIVCHVQWGQWSLVWLVKR